MEFKVYIESFKGMPLDDWGFNAFIGYNRKGTSIKLFEEPDFDFLPKSKWNIMIASIDLTVKYLRALGVDIPQPMNIPYQLQDYAKRNIGIVSVTDVLELETPPIFIKPHAELKKFPAGVIRSETYMKEFLGAMDPNEKVFISDVIDIVSEYRGFVVHNKLESLNHYAGDFRKYPDVAIIDQAVQDFIDNSVGGDETRIPDGYTIDFGVTAQGETVLIECNDGWSVGSYGCDPLIYTRMLGQRWLQLTRHLPR